LASDGQNEHNAPGFPIRQGASDNLKNYLIIKHAIFLYFKSGETKFYGLNTFEYSLTNIDGKSKSLADRCAWHIDPWYESDFTTV